MATCALPSLMLAVEQSTPQASLALFRDGILVAHQAWTAPPRDHQRLFHELPAWLAAHDTALDALRHFAVGLGPGSFTGLRIALTAVCAYALPSGAPVTGVAGDAALAVRVAAETGLPAVCVMGDARRGRLWLARYDVENGDACLRGSRVLAPAEEITQDLVAGAALVSPDWDSVHAVLPATTRAAAARMVGAAVPQARDVGALALTRLGRGRPSEPLAPLYLHPAVLTAPRFSAAGLPLAP